MLDHVIAAVRRDWNKTRTLLGYVKRRMLEISTWAAIGTALTAANGLKPPYAVASILIAIVMVLLPGKAMLPAKD